MGKVVLEINDDIIFEIRNALSGHINVMLERLLQDFPNLSIGEDLEQAFEKIENIEIKSALGKAIRIQKISDKIDEYLSKQIQYE